MESSLTDPWAVWRYQAEKGRQEGTKRRGKTAGRWKANAPMVEFAAGLLPGVMSLRCQKAAQWVMSFGIGFKIFLFEKRKIMIGKNPDFFIYLERMEQNGIFFE